MYRIEKVANDELDFLMNLRRTCLAELKKMPQGRLVFSLSKDHRYYSKYVDDRRIYLGSEANEEVGKLQRRRFLEQSIREIDGNVKALHRLIGSYVPFDVTKVLEKTATHRTDLKSLLNITENRNQCPWTDCQGTGEKKYEDGLRHRSNSGVLMRSKSEVIIANILDEKNIPYEYEPSIIISGITFTPDFIPINKRTGRRTIVEHIGLVSDPVYRKNTLWKMDVYFSAGLIPWRDVIFTYDDASGNIDTYTISKIIDVFFT